MFETVTLDFVLGIAPRLGLIPYIKIAEGFHYTETAVDTKNDDRAAA